MLKVIKYFSLAFILTALSIATYIEINDIPLSNFSSLFNPKINVASVQSLLNDGFPEIEKAIALRDKLATQNRDFNTEKHLPELETQLPILVNYYQVAVKNYPEKQGPLASILKQIKAEFDKKSMPLWKWMLFHQQLNVLFTDPKDLYGKYKKGPIRNWGHLDFNKFKAQAVEKLPSLPWPVYVNNGTVGLQALNFAFINDIMVVGMATDQNLEVDGQKYSPIVFTSHDIGHFMQYKQSHWAQKRFKAQLSNLYAQIEQQPLIERARDHFALFMLIHEFPYGSGYADNLQDNLNLSHESLVSALQYFITSPAKKDPMPKELIFEKITAQPLGLFEHDGVDIKKINDQQFSVTGFLYQKNVKNPKKLHNVMVNLSQGDKGLIISYPDLQGKIITSTIEDAYNQFPYKDLAPILLLLGIKLSDPPLEGEIIKNVITVVNQFVKKYGK